MLFFKWHTFVKYAINQKHKNFKSKNLKNSEDSIIIKYIVFPIPKYKNLFKMFNPQFLILS